MDTHLLNLIQGSFMLSQAEKQYWISHLHRMNPEQMEKLKTILERANNVPWTKHVGEYLKAIGSSAKNFVGTSSS